MYEDGADDELDRDELDKCACAVGDVPETSLQFLQTLLESKTPACASAPSSTPSIKKKRGRPRKTPDSSTPRQQDSREKKRGRPPTIGGGRDRRDPGSSIKKRGAGGSLCGEYIARNFEGFGTFFGLVSSFDDPFYKVRLGCCLWTGLDWGAQCDCSVPSCLILPCPHVALP